MLPTAVSTAELARLLGANSAFIRMSGLSHASALPGARQRRVKQRRTDMLMLDRRTLLRAGSAAIAVGAAALAPTAPALARAPEVGKQAQPGFDATGQCRRRERRP